MTVGSLSPKSQTIAKTPKVAVKSYDSTKTKATPPPPLATTRSITSSPARKSTLTTTSTPTITVRKRKSIEGTKSGTPQEKKQKALGGEESSPASKIKTIHREVAKSNHIHLCKLPFTCETFLYNKSPNNLEHSRQFGHVCLYGQSCSNLGDPEHCRTCIHLRKEVCRANPCKKLTDPRHRAEYHHPRLWDYLIPCRRSTKCNDTSEEHRRKYQHEPIPIFPQLN